MPSHTILQARLVHVKGLVQGIGFRPFVYRLATTSDLAGWIENRTDGVSIRIQGPLTQIAGFVKTLREAPPPLSRITAITVTDVPPDSATDFIIRESQDSPTSVTQVSPDIAVCPQCLADMRNQPHRLNYPFINCTLCGPRFSIVEDLPYDRGRTTMAVFPLCPTCGREYGDVNDRRFHAQPVACNACGPQYELVQGESVTKGTEAILARLVALLRQSAVVAMKGIGGYHLACNALDPQAVAALRQRKRRDGKPFAVMFASVDALREFANIEPEEEQLLLSSERPVVLLRARSPLASGVCAGLPTVGALLPYMPLHYLLFERLGLPALVLTSGNVSEEPIVIDNEIACRVLAPIADAVLTHNRGISNRTDDSVAMVVSGQARLLRRSRGYVPAPVELGYSVDGIFAAGAELKNCFALGRESQAILSQHIGDLKGAATYEFYHESVTKFMRLLRVNPSLAACDLHPDYLSTRYAQETGLPLVQVQHHHAHVAACMAEYGLDEPVIGVAFDGTGYGVDGTIWGGEFLVCDLAACERVAHLKPIPMPGADKAVEEPWRMAVACLYGTFGDDLGSLRLPFLASIPGDSLQMTVTALVKSINCPLTSGAGRLFDAVAAMTGLCAQATFEAEPAMRLEAAVDPAVTSSYPMGDGTVLDTSPLIRAIVDDLVAAMPVSAIAAKFHNAIVRSVCGVAGRIRRERGLSKVVLSGGIFQNRCILGRSEALLKAQRFEVFAPHTIPANDGGIALGQLAVAARRRELGCA